MLGGRVFMFAASAVATGPGHSLSDCDAMEPEHPIPPPEPKGDAETRKIVREILDLLPQDVVEELNKGQIDPNDAAFMDGLTDHVARLSLADPRNGQKILGKFVRLKKQIRRSLRTSDPDVVTS